MRPVVCAPQSNRDLDHRADLEDDEADVAEVMDGEAVAEPGVFVVLVFLLFAIAIR